MTGYRRKSGQARLVLLAWLMGCMAAQSNADEESLPGMALLEFLAEWETTDGQWLDPVDLEEPAQQAPDDADAEVPHE